MHEAQPLEALRRKVNAEQRTARGRRTRQATCAIPKSNYVKSQATPQSEPPRRPARGPWRMPRPNSWSNDPAVCPLTPAYDALRWNKASARRRATRRAEAGPWPSEPGDPSAAPRARQTHRRRRLGAREPSVAPSGAGSRVDGRSRTGPRRPQAKCWTSRRFSTQSFSCASNGSG